MFKFFIWLLDFVVTQFLNYIMNTKYCYDDDFESQGEHDLYYRKGYYSVLLTLIVYGQRFIDLPRTDDKYHTGYNLISGTLDMMIEEYNRKSKSADSDLSLQREGGAENV